MGRTDWESALLDCIEKCGFEGKHGLSQKSVGLRSPALHFGCSTGPPRRRKHSYFGQSVLQRVLKVHPWRNLIVDAISSGRNWKTCSRSYHCLEIRKTLFEQMARSFRLVQTQSKQCYDRTAPGRVVRFDANATRHQRELSSNNQEPYLCRRKEEKRRLRSCICIGESEGRRFDFCKTSYSSLLDFVAGKMDRQCVFDAPESRF